MWEDVNNNGVVDAGEPGIAGVRVELLTPDGNTVLATTTTDAAGNYLFTGLVAGTYRVRVTTPAGYRSSTGVNGATSGPYEAATDAHRQRRPRHDRRPRPPVPSRSRSASRAAPPTRTRPPTAPEPGQPRQDFGFYRPLAIGDLVWNDANNNGVRDAGEAGIAGVTVRLLDGTGSVAPAPARPRRGCTASTTCRRAYQVEIVPPAGYVSSTGTGDLSGPGTGPFEPAPGTNVESNDNGTAIGGVIRAVQITLGVPGSA